jgi:hypothetical protein
MKTIKDLPEHSRPREKLREKGAAAPTDEELVAAILGMRTKGIDVRTIARHGRGGFLNLCHKWIGQAGINNSVLASVEVPLPPLAEQERLVAELEGYRNVIDANPN